MRWGRRIRQKVRMKKEKEGLIADREIDDGWLQTRYCKG